MRKGPWLMDPQIGSVTVMLERDNPGSVAVRAWRLVPEDDRAEALAGSRTPDVEVRDGARALLHEVRLEGLVPGARYRYEISGPGLVATGGTFTSPPDHAEPFRFVLYGDSRSGDAVHAAVARAMAQEGADFVVHTGDMIADGREELLWQRFFDIERGLLSNVIFVPVIGNHEIMHPFPEGTDNFRKYVRCTPNSPRPELDYAIAYGNVRMILANAFDDWAAPEMRTWLDRELARARSEAPEGFLLVAMHWGMCSSSMHGENRRLRDAGLDDLFRHYRVDLVIAGHDHSFERGDDHGLRYLVTGGGGAPLYPQVAPQPYTHVYIREHHYIRADVEHDGIVLTAVRPDGTELDRCTLRHTHWDCPLRTNVAAASTLVSGAAPRASQSASSHSCGCSVPGQGARRSPAGGCAVVALTVAGALSRRVRHRRLFS